MFLVKPNPGLFPESREDLEEKIESSTETFEEYSTVGKAKCLISRGIRAVVFGGGSILFTGLVFLLTGFFLIEGYNGSLDYLGLILLISQVVFFFGSSVLGRFASVVNPDSAPWIFVPEYKKAEILSNRDEIEFEYDPSEFFELNQWFPNEGVDILGDDADYLIPLPDED